MRKSSILIILATLFTLNLLVWLAVLELDQTQYLEVTFFDVGQGDSIFIETPSGHQILIDGGPDSTVLEKLGREMPFYDRTIDLIILTHPEHDHFSGLLEVLKRYRVENILWTGVVRDTAEYREWVELIQAEEANIYIAEAGQRIETGQMSVDILYPFENMADEFVKDANNTSIVARLIFGENSFLFTGDIIQSLEKEIMQSKAKVDSDVLKVGHHGSKTSTSLEFLNEVSPEIAVIQVGQDNSYGHPAEETLASLANYGIKVLRTDLNKDIKILCNLQSLRLVFRD